MPNSEISLLCRFREIWCRTHHIHHQNHGLDVGRARWFGPEWPGFRDMAWPESASLGCEGPRWAAGHGEPKSPFLGQKMGAEAARGDTVEWCGRKKVAGRLYELRGEGFGPFWAAGPAGGGLYWVLEQLY